MKEFKSVMKSILIGYVIIVIAIGIGTGLDAVGSMIVKQFKQTSLYVSSVKTNFCEQKK
jgi:hypothetical protein